MKTIKDCHRGEGRGPSDNRLQRRKAWMPAFAGMTSLFVFFAASAAHAADDFKKYNTGKPISIEANSLEVLQNEKKAIFQGGVTASQGDIRLKANKMTVYYKGGGMPGADAGGAGTGISRIDVDGNVFLATPQESAQGSKGVYDVDKKTIHLLGGVVLTRGQNVLKGSALEYNLATGKSLLSGGASATVDGKPAPGGRVKALFVPEQGK